MNLLLCLVLTQDFNGDGYGDLAIGTPAEDVGGYTDAGAVTVLYGSANGLASPYAQQWTQDSTGVANFCESGDQFGVAVGYGDFDGNGYDDLAIGANLEDLAASNCGAIHVLYGGPNGLTATGNDFLHQDSWTVLDACEANDQFGSAVAGGDFNGDGYDDLAVGVIYEDLLARPATIQDCGAVAVFYGSAGGLTTSGNQLWSQNSASVPDTNETSDYFGRRLVSGDFDGDGRADLAVGIPYEDISGHPDAGAVIVLRGAASGLTGTNSQFWSQASLSSPLENNDSFGWALAAGDFDGNGADDLAIGAPAESLEGTSTIAEAGSVAVFRGTVGTGLTVSGAQNWTQTSTSKDTSEAYEWFGYALAAGDYNGDGRADLAIGVPFEGVSTGAQGAINVLYGGAVGLSQTSAQFLHQGSLGFLDAPENGDSFGFSLHAGRFLGGSRSALAVGVPYEDVGMVVDAGAVEALYGGPGGLGTSGAQLWNQSNWGLPYDTETFDRFGSIL